MEEIIEYRSPQPMEGVFEGYNRSSEQWNKEMENSQNSRQGNINDQVSVDVTAITLSLIEEFKQLHPVSREPCIYRVTKRIKEINEKAYTPRCVSIGPYHHGKDELKAMEEHKTMYLHLLLRFSNVGLLEFVSCVRDNGKKLRNCYQERIDLSSEIFVRLMTVDSAFVIMVMLRSCFEQFRNEDELLFNKPSMIHDILKDIILLENQLPFFILDHFFVLSNLVVPIPNFSMFKLSSVFLAYQFPFWEVNHSGGLNFSTSKHPVDFLRIGQQPLEQNQHKQVKTLEVMNFPSAVELNRAGVKFKRGSSLRLVDINFCDGILEIPTLKLLDSTEILFRNVQAFEQCGFIDGYFNDYIFMISLLVTNEKDVRILIENGIIENLLRGNKQVVHLFHNLVKENDIDTKKFYFTDVVNDINKYFNRRRNRWRYRLRAMYEDDVVVTSLTIYALLFTIIQTICSILQITEQ